MPWMTSEWKHELSELHRQAKALRAGKSVHAVDGRVIDPPPRPYVFKKGTGICRMERAAHAAMIADIRAAGMDPYAARRARRAYLAADIRERFGGESLAPADPAVEAERQAAFVRETEQLDAAWRARHEERCGLGEMYAAAA
jgi:hypothetical protein